MDLLKYTWVRGSSSGSTGHENSKRHVIHVMSFEIQHTWPWASSGLVVVHQWYRWGKVSSPEHQNHIQQRLDEDTESFINFQASEKHQPISVLVDEENFLLPWTFLQPFGRQVEIEQCLLQNSMTGSTTTYMTGVMLFDYGAAKGFPHYDGGLLCSIRPASFSEDQQQVVRSSCRSISQDVQRNLMQKVPCPVHRVRIHRKNRIVAARDDCSKQPATPNLVSVKSSPKDPRFLSGLKNSWKASSFQKFVYCVDFDVDLFFSSAAPALMCMALR